jgi:hypothetical protein
MRRGDILIGVGAGLVSALLFATVIRGSLTAVLLFYLTPLPIAIVSLGWEHRCGLVASLVGAIAVGLIVGPLSGLWFALSSALPIWWLSYLALLAREGAQFASPSQYAAPNQFSPSNQLAAPSMAGPVGGMAQPDGMARSSPPNVVWYPLGRLALWAGWLSALLIFAFAVMLGPDYDTFVATIQDGVTPALKASMDELPGLNDGAVSVERLATLFALVIMPIGAAMLTLLTLVILLVAAKIVSLSGRLPRPLPAISREFVLPPATLAGIAAAILLGPFAGWPRFVAFALAGTAGMLFAMQGLATMHVLVARIAARPLILGVGYAMLVVASPWVLIGLAVLGLADMGFGLRARLIAKAAANPL